MHRSGWNYLWLAIACLCLAGCGGGGLTLSGGSVPVGGRAITGTALLPDSTPAANAQVAVRSLPVGATLQTASTDSSGRFTVQGVPTNSDISVVITQSSGNRLEVVIPRAGLSANPRQPLDIGSVTALTTLVAAAIHLEHGPAPEDADSIISNQEDHLTMRVHDAGYSMEMQRQFITDSNSLQAQALTLIVPVANTELAAFRMTPSADTADTALNGLLGYVRAAHRRELHLSGSKRSALISAQLAGTIYSPDTVAAALTSAGVPHVTSVEVTAASQRERTELTELANMGSGITAYEALVIAADVNSHGGFQADQNMLDKFLAALLKP